MKRLIFIMMLVPAGLLFSKRSQAQLSVSINIGNQPAWAPEGYDEAQYYYIPDMDMYYDVPAHQFCIPEQSSLGSRQLYCQPATAIMICYRIHKVPINQRDAYKFHDRDRQQYAQFKGKFDQHSIRDSKDNKYSQNRANWDNNRWRGQHDNRKNDSHRDQGHGGDHH